MEEKDKDWASLDNDASLGDMNDGYSMPSDDPPTEDFEQKLILNNSWCQKIFTFWIHPPKLLLLPPSMWK
jgi:hypothetical protein